MPSSLETHYASPSWHGKLHLQFIRHQHHTQQRLLHIQAPLKVQRPFYPEGPDLCHTTLLHTAGGLVGGDRLSLGLYLAPQTQVLVTTAAASKVYGLGSNFQRSDFPPPCTNQRATQAIEMVLAEESHLEWLPQDTIVFKDAHFQQTLRVELAPTATWLGWEITRLGRTAQGEAFLAGDWRSRTQVWQQGKPLWIDVQWIPGNETIWQSPHGLAGQPIVATLAWIGQRVDLEWVEQVRSLWQPGQGQGNPIPTDLRSGSPPEIGVTRLPQGLVCRYRGASSHEAKQWFIAIWNQIRLTYRGRSAQLPRVWPIS